MQKNIQGFVCNFFLFLFYCCILFFIPVPQLIHKIQMVKNRNVNNIMMLEDEELQLDRQVSEFRQRLLMSAVFCLNLRVLS